MWVDCACLLAHFVCIIMIVLVECRRWKNERFVETHCKTVAIERWLTMLIFFFLTRVFFARETFFNESLNFLSLYISAFQIIVHGFCSSCPFEIQDWFEVMCCFLLPDSLLVTLMTFAHVKTWHITTDACMMMYRKYRYTDIYTFIYVWSLMLHLLAQHKHITNGCVH